MDFNDNYYSPNFNTFGSASPRKKQTYEENYTSENEYDGPKNISTKLTDGPKNISTKQTL